MTPAWLEMKEGGTLIRLVIQPRASKTEISGLRGEPPRLKIRVAAPPIEGEANSELTAFLSKKLGVARSRIQILRGATGKTKDVFCEGITPDQVAQAVVGDSGVR